MEILNRNSRLAFWNITKLETTFSLNRQIYDVHIIQTEINMLSYESEEKNQIQLHSTHLDIAVMHLYLHENNVRWEEIKTGMERDEYRHIYSFQQTCAHLL